MTPTITAILDYAMRQGAGTVSRTPTVALIDFQDIEDAAICYDKITTNVAAAKYGGLPFQIVKAPQTGGAKKTTITYPEGHVIVVWLYGSTVSMQAYSTAQPPKPQSRFARFLQWLNGLV